MSEFVCTAAGGAATAALTGADEAGVTGVVPSLVGVETTVIGAGCGAGAVAPAATFKIPGPPCTKMVRGGSGEHPQLGQI